MRIRELLSRDKKDSNGTENDYRQALLIISNHLNAFITEYGDKTGLSPTQVTQKVNNWDLNQWKQAVKQVSMVHLSPDAKARYRYYSQTAGINRNYLISAIIGVAFLAITDRQETRINNRIDWDVGDVKAVYKVPQKQVKKVVTENVRNWSSDLWLKSDAMTAQVQAVINKKLSSTLTHADVTKMFDYTNVNSDGVRAVRTMVSSTDRLLRTETARVVHKAKMVAFKKEHIAMVDMVVEPGVCDECEEIQEGSPFLLEDAPDIPIHPNCRCSLIPHGESGVELSF